MTEYVGRIFDGELIDLGGARWKQCTFRNCRLIYTGNEFGGFEDCVIENCQWVFDGAADNTLFFLTSLYHDASPEGERLVQALFAGIRKGSFTRSRDLSGQPVSA